MSRDGEQPAESRPSLEILMRTEQPRDAGAVAEVLEAAFEPGERMPELVEALRPYSRSPQHGQLRAFVVEAGGVVLGHVMLTRCFIDAWEELVPALVLGPLAVRPEVQRLGLGSGLVEMAIRAAMGEGAPAVLLEGSPRFYRRLGFESAEPLGFRRPSLRIPVPAFQIRRLAGYRSWMQGTVVYAQPFWDFDAVGLRDRTIVEQIEATFG